MFRQEKLKLEKMYWLPESKPVSLIIDLIQQKIVESSVDIRLRFKPTYSIPNKAHFIKFDLPSPERDIFSLEELNTLEEQIVKQITEDQIDKIYRKIYLFSNNTDYSCTYLDLSYVLGIHRGKHYLILYWKL